MHGQANRRILPGCHTSASRKMSQVSYGLFFQCADGFMDTTLEQRNLQSYPLRSAKVGLGGAKTGPGRAKMEQKSPPGGDGLPSKSWCTPRGWGAILGRFWGAQRGPKTRRFEALSVTKWGRDFGAIWGSILERLGVPKRGVLRHNKRVKKQDKDRMRVGENNGKTRGKTHILHFRKRPGAKKKEVKRQKIGLQKGERNLAPKRSQNGPFLGPKSGPNRSKKRRKKIVTKKVREKEV